jgi:hypothetical protein
MLTVTRIPPPSTWTRLWWWMAHICYRIAGTPLN